MQRVALDQGRAARAHNLEFRLLVAAQFIVADPPARLLAHDQPGAAAIAQSVPLNVRTRASPQLQPRLRIGVNLIVCEVRLRPRLGLNDGRRRRSFDPSAHRIRCARLADKRGAKLGRII